MSYSVFTSFEDFKGIPAGMRLRGTGIGVVP